MRDQYNTPPMRPHPRSVSETNPRSLPRCQNAISLDFGLVRLARDASDCTAFHTWAWLTRSLRCAHIMFIGFPLVFATLMATMRCLVKVKILNKCTRTLLFAAANCFLHWVSIQSGRIVSHLAESEAGLVRLLRLLFLVFQSLLVFYFFQDGGTKQQTVKIARRLKDVTKDVAHVAHGRATRREQEIELVVPEAMASH
eukprot:s3910_g3.t1